MAANKSVLPDGLLEELETEVDLAIRREAKGLIDAVSVLTAEYRHGHCRWSELCARVQRLAAKRSPPARTLAARSVAAMLQGARPPDG